MTIVTETDRTSSSLTRKECISKTPDIFQLDGLFLLARIKLKVKYAKSVTAEIY